MLIKSQVKRMHVLNDCVSNGFIYLLYMTRFVCTIWSQDCFIIFPVDLTYETRTPETKMACFQGDQLYKNIRNFASPSYCSYSIKKLTAQTYHDFTARNSRNTVCN